MSNRKHVATSKEAELLKSAESKSRDYDRITKALAVLGSANYDTIAKQMAVIDANVVSRRLKELCLLGMIRNTGVKSLTRRNRNAFNYCLINQPKTEAEISELKPEKSLSGESVSDFSRKINSITQQNLFQ